MYADASIAIGTIIYILAVVVLLAVIAIWIRRHHRGAPPALWLGYVTGLFGLFVALYSLDSPNRGDAGLALLASAVAFGLIANAIYRQERSAEKEASIERQAQPRPATRSRVEA